MNERTNELYSPIKAGYRTGRNLTKLAAMEAEDYLQWGTGCWNTVHGANRSTQGLNWSLPRTVLTVAFGDEDANSRYKYSVRRRGAVCTTTVVVFHVQDTQSEERDFFAGPRPRPRP